ncbi:hypothetical protein NF867_16425 [Solitalea sp. MAHUQ-68]|uniref:Uncharacterized protein n=1 Tax=Solitalea agri TaxID=2953739 RepID=A0A9X2F453_9SPHI|nr:hypothetical protein [Solitalea agri]MCO4294449.1 hypothetical protein [Solitalea agri]
MNEVVSTIYRELFSIKFVHPAYETPQKSFIDQHIQIDTDIKTNELFRNNRIKYRFNENILVCFIETTAFNPPAAEPKVPFVALPSDLKIRFLISSSSDFLSKTYALASGSVLTYRFSNQVNNIDGGIKLLTAPVQTHSLAKDYMVGTLVKSGSNLFTPMKTVLASQGIAITDTAFWKQLPGVSQVVNNADLENNSAVNSSSICFAVIDIHKTGTTNNSYKILNTGDKLFNPAPVFTIKFKSRV